MDSNLSAANERRWTALINDVRAIYKHLHFIQMMVVMLTIFSGMIFIMTLKAAFIGSTADWVYIVLGFPAFLLQGVIIKVLMEDRK